MTAAVRGGRLAVVTALLVVVLDQVTKYGAGRWYHFSGHSAWWTWEGFVVNEGGSGHLPRAVVTLWELPHGGATLDVLAVTTLLLASYVLARTGVLTGRAGLLAAVSATMFLAGNASNLADRLGVAALTHPGTPRGAIDWIPTWYSAINLADVFLCTGLIGISVTLGRALLRLPTPLPVRILLFGVTATICLHTPYLLLFGASEALTSAVHSLTAPLDVPGSP